MSLFDMLRYPLSDRPTEEEVSNLPLRCRIYLSKELGFSVDGNFASVAATYLRIMLRQPINHERAKRIIKEVRKIIKEMP